MSLDSLLDRLAGQPMLPRRKKRLRPARFYVEALEGRVLLTTYTVTTTALFFNGDPAGVDQLGLATAIIDANNNVQNTVSGPAIIDFKIPGSGLQTISVAPNPNSPGEQILPTIARPVTIDGTTQSGYTPGHPTIDIGGTKAGPNVNGLAFTVGGNTVKGLIINNFSGTGIILDGTGDTSHGQGPGINNTIQDCWIGTDGTGKNAAPNDSGGLQILNSSYNLIGGLNSGGQLTTGNLISGNGENGVFLASALDSHNYVEGNYIGTDITGLEPIAGAQSASYGVALVPPLASSNLGYASNNYIGDFDPAEKAFDPNGRNIIAGNTADGVLVVGGTGNQITGNYIGIGADGTTPVGNSEDGVFLEDASSNIVGGTQTATRNVISANGHNGVAILADSATQYGLAIPVAQEGGSLNIVLGNYIGTDADGLVISVVTVDAQGHSQTKLLGNAVDGVRVENDATDPSVSMSQNVIGGTNTSSQLTGGNLISGNLDSGVVLNGPRVTLNTVDGNFIGTDNSGTHTLANSNAGVKLNSIVGQGQGPSNNFIGVPGAGNVISGNGTAAVGTSGQPGFTPASGEGVLIDNGSNGNFVQANQIGTTPNGLATMPNVQGVLIADSSGNVVGGTQAGQGNLISGNGQDGVVIAGDGSSNNKLYENSIGVDSSGGPLGNGDVGVLIQGLASDNFVGGTQTVGGVTTSLGNTIAANGIGVAIQSRAHDNQVIGNLIGSSHLAGGLSTNVGLANGIGVDILDSDSNTVGGLTSAVRSNPVGKLTDVAANIIVNSAADGVEIADTNGIAGNPHVVTTGNVVEGNYIGIENDGSTKLANGGDGVQILSADGNTIGGSVQGAGNVISGNGQSGVDLQGAATGNTVAGNLIGTTADGNFAVITNYVGQPNNPDGGTGVAIESGATLNLIGRPGPFGGNVISGNPTGGVALRGAGSTNTIAYNEIGLNAGGTAELANSATQSFGILVAGTPGTIIGAASFSQGGNVISGNTGDGILLTDTPTVGTQISGNFIGTDAADRNPFGNGGFGIDITGLSQTLGHASGSMVTNNVVSGNLRGGIALSNNATGNQIASNFIGTDTQSAFLLPNSGVAIEINNAPNNIIGGPNSTLGNQITNTQPNLNPPPTAIQFEASGNGILIAGSGSIGNHVENNTVVANSNTGVVISASASGNYIGGAAQGNTIINNGNNGITIVSAADNVVQGNLIGVQKIGGAGEPAGNDSNGILLSAALGNLIGTNSPDPTHALANVISASKRFGGVFLSSGSNGNTVAGNLIGTNLQGTAQQGFGNVEGVQIADSSNNVIGGEAQSNGAAPGNEILGNGGGVLIAFGDSQHNKVQGNNISGSTGLTGTGGTFLQGWGVSIEGGSNNFVGGPNAADGNTISDNGGNGVEVTSGTGNAIGSNLIFGNGQLGVSLQPVNGSAGGNNQQKAPFLQLATSYDSHRIAGIVQGTPNTTYYLQFFSGTTSQHADGSRNDDAEAIVYVNTDLPLPSVTTSNGGFANFDFDFRETFSVNVAAGMILRATVTDASGNTSQFSNPVTVQKDSNGDGVPDVDELKAGNGKSTNANVVSFPDIFNNAFFTLSAPAGMQFTNVWSTQDPDPGDPNGGPPSNAQFGEGFVSFQLTGVQPGAAVVVTMTLPTSGTDPTSYWRYGKTPDNQTDHWYNWIWDGNPNHTGAEINGHTIKLHLIDGALGDDDLSANGIIVDPGAPGFPDPYTVTTNADSGPGSLRQAILNADANPFNTITFDLPGTGPQTIQLLSPLPAITADVTIDGSTEPGFAGPPLVVLDGSQAGAGADGFKVTSGFAKIQDLVIDQFAGDGIHVLSGGSAIIVGNYIGTDASGKVAQGNGLYGVEIDDDTPDPTDPDNDGDDDNASDNADNDDDAGQSQSITIDGGNVISANLAGGISLHGAAAKDHQITKNFIGTQADGVSPLGNGGPGVVIDGGSNFNTIGFEPGTGNTIAFNAGPGVKIVNGINNLIESNSIFANQGLGIDLAGGQNANESQVAPVLAGATSYGGQTFISGTLTSTPNSSYTIDLYATDQGNESGGAQGQFLLGSVTVTTDNNGQTSFDVDLAMSAASGSFITATASLNDGETSPFSAPFALTPTNPLVLIVNTGNDVPDPDCGLFTLRQAILASNAHPGENTIDFDLPNSDRVIQPQSALPTITDPVIIDGTSQPGYQGLPLVDLDGSQAGAGADGLDITCGGSIVRGLAIHSFSGNGIDLAGLGGNLIEGDFLGTDVTGTKAMPDQGLDLYLNGSPNNLIGGTTAAARNVILDVDLAGTGSTDNLVEGNYIGSDLTGTVVLENGFRHGIEIAGGSNTIGGLQAGAGNLIERGLVIDGNSNSNIVQGNLIGTDVTGTAFLSSGAGFSNLTDVEVFGSDNQIGGTIAAARNIIPGGVSLEGGANLVQGNYIGTDITGTIALGGLLGSGFYVGGFSNTIGGTQPGAGNLISGMGNDGISVGSASNTLIQGNRIGTDFTGTKALGNYGQGIQDAGNDDTIGGHLLGAGNLISGNGYSGILLNGSGDVVEGNLIGTDHTGTKKIGNGRNWLSNLANLTSNDFAAGIGLRESGAIIGGSQPGDGNVISGNVGDGIAATFAVRVTGLVIQGNDIGTDVTGTLPLANGADGVSIIDCNTPNAVLGGALPGSGNVIAANAGDGIRVSDSTSFALGGAISSGIVIQGNKIGTDVTGTHNLGNAGDGVSLITSNLLASDETIGGTSPGEGNTIAFNGGRGVDIPSGNGNTVRANDIFDNGGLGLITDINGAAATYAENRGIRPAQAPPVLTSAVFNPQGTVLSGSLMGTPFTRYEIDFFANDAVNPTGFGDGQTYLQSISVVADGTGSAQFQIPLDEAVPIGQWITATATPDTSGGNTSTFSQPTPVVAAAGKTVQFSSPNYQVTETGGKGVIVVRRSGDTSGTATVDYATTGGTAAAGVNYTAESGTLTFAAGVASQTITVPIKDDGQADGDKDFQIVLSSPGGSSLGAVSAADVTIADSDTAGQIEFSSSTYSVDLALAREAEGTAAGVPPSVFTIARTGGSQGAVSVDYRVTGGTAVSAGYVEDSFGTVTFAPGQTTVQIQFGYGEPAYQGPQTLQVTIGNPTGGAVLGAITTSVLTIDDPEDQNGAFRIPSQLQVYESGDQITAASAPQTFKLSSDAMFKVTVGATSTTVDLPASTTASNATVDSLVNELDTALQAAGLGGNPTVTTKLVYNVYANASSTGAIMLITNAPASLGPFSISDAGPGASNDGYAELGFTNPQGAASQAVIEVDRLGQSSTTEEVSYNTVDGTAKAGTNYVATSGTLTFQRGQTQADIDVPIIDDHLNDNPGIFQVMLSDPTDGAVVLGGLGQSTVTILDRDASAPFPPATLVVETVNNQGSFGGFPENSGTAVVTVKRVNAITGVADGDGATGEVRVDYATSDGTAHAGSDYTAESGTLTFAPGQAFAKFSVPLIPGQDVPDTRTFLVTLSNVVGDAVISADNPVTETIDGTPGQINIASPTYTVAENKTALTVTVTNLPGGNKVAANVTVDYATHDGTATAGKDYMAVSGTLTFTPFTAGATSQTITIPILNDQLLENNPATFSLTLSNPTGGPILGNTSTTAITILEDGDSQIPMVPSTTTVESDKPNGSVYGQAVTFTATVSAATGMPSGAVDFVDMTTGQDLGSVPLVLVDCNGVASLTVSSLGVGSDTIVANYTGDTGTYMVSHGSLTQLVTPAKLKVTAPNEFMVFGATVPALTDTITGFVNGDTASVVSGAASLSAAATPTSGVGLYPITIGQGTLSAANYTFTFVGGFLSVVPAKLTLTVTAANETMVYGSTVPTLSDTITGFVEGDTASVVSGAPSITTTATSASGVGTYPIDVSLGTLSATNYTFAFALGTLTVTPATLTVTAGSTTMVYGAAVPAVTDTITGFVNGDTSSVVTGTASLGTIATSASGVGTYAYTVGLGTLSAANYTFAFVGGTLAVTPVTLTVTANNQTQIYGAADPPLTATITGFVNGDASNVVSGAASLSTPATSASGVGTYAITAGLGTLSAANYTFAFASGTLTVTPGTLTVTADDQTMVYGAAVPTLTATITGFVNGDTASVVSGTPNLSTAATTASGIGSYAITAAGTLSAANYTFALVNGTLSVTPATLTVTPDDQTMVYGATVPTLTATITGFVNGDTSSVVSGAASLGTTAISASDVGSYRITAVPGTLSAANYTFVFVNGTLTVTPATLTVTADNKTMVFGAAVPALTDTITGLVNGDTTDVVSGTASLSTTATSTSGVGSYAITVGTGTLSALDYTFTFAGGTLSVVAATLKLTVTADDQTMVYGSAVPVLTDTISGFVNGDTASVVSGAASLSTTATSASGVGSYPIDVSHGTLSAANYTFAFVNGTLTVTPATLTVLADDQTMVFGATVPALTDMIFGFVNGDTSSVVSGGASLSTAATSASGVGSYPIDVSLGTLSAANYVFAFVNGTLTVTPGSNTPVLTLVHDSAASATEGSATTLTSTLLETTDSDSSAAASAIVYTITAAPTLGTLTDHGVPLAEGSTLSQQDINDGSVTYQSTEEGADSFGFSVASGAASPITGTLGITVSDPAVVAMGGFTYSATAGAAGAMQTLATFTDPGGAEALADYAATIDWGDGTSAAAGELVVDPSTHAFNVNGAHTYAQDGTFTVTVTLTHDNATSVTATSSASIASATGTGAGGIAASGVAVSGYEFSALAGVTVATFTDTNGSLSANDFSAVINWGDGTASAGSITLASGTYTVTGSHPYLDEGHYAIKVSINQTAGEVTGGTSATVSATATIHEQRLANAAVGTPDQNYIQEIYRDLFGRQAETQGLDYWVAELAKGISRQQVAFQMVKIASFEEFQHDTVAALYKQYLGRAPDAAGLAYWSAYLYDGGTIEGMSQALVSSPEYFQKRGEGTADGFLSAAFHDALGRQIEPAAVTYFKGLMSKGWSAADVAAAIFNSDEYHRLRTNSLFEQFLDRPADPRALAYFASELDDGDTDEFVISQLLASDEYYSLAQA